MNKIFVQIASYKDPELVLTIKDLLEKAEYPENLTIAVCNQTDDFSNLDEFKKDSRFKIINILSKESKGVCFARNKLQSLWKDEKYTLQIDSHHRFIKNWDSILIKMLEDLNSPKPLITAYLSPYNPKNNHKTNEPYFMVPMQFNFYDVLIFIPKIIENYNSLKNPINARFISAHFIFTHGIFNKECIYDPNIYFHGEEIMLSIRAFTKGYDLFHPHYCIAWHEYTRNGRTKHWDENEYAKIDYDAQTRISNFFKTKDQSFLNGYGLGIIKTFEEYESYIGVNFKNQIIHPKIIEGENPPINDDSEWWNIPQKEYEYVLKIPKPKYDYDQMFIGIETKNNKLIYRIDISKNDYTELLDVSFKSTLKPYKVIYWPYTEKSFLDKSEFILN
jgi:hypothetical protein